MGFIAMILSFIFGILLIVFGISYKKGKLIRAVTPIMGIGLVAFAVWLGLPK
ncbi:hypothetical protein [uncultured Ruminococcus sp.]|uniref:hypothetical protein n=1 Tax=uncultured Ruminococcus sp. TaxID=165186 RepID=UPI0025D20345|nr:hypothetical protein [uncultured Ruminococcus sp.]